MVLVLTGVSSARSTVWGEPPGLPSSPTTGLRTDRLSAAQLRSWKAIVDIVRAEDRDHRPLHPTLRGLYDAVNGGPHTVFIEMLDRKSYIGGHFEVRSVDPDGRAHQGILILNLRAIDRASTDRGAVRADGFIPFKGLGRIERYAEVLAHELAHAAWHFASTERARLAYRLHAEVEERARMVLKGGPDTRAAGQTDVDQRVRELERQAETAERAVWEELQAAKRGRPLFAHREERKFPD